MATLSCSTCRHQMLNSRSGRYSHRQPIGQPRKLRTPACGTVRCNAAALGPSGSIEDGHGHDQHNQQHRVPSLAPPPSRQQLVRPVYAVATEAPANPDAAAAVPSTSNGQRPVLFNSIQQAGTVVTAGQPARSTVINIDEENARDGVNSSSRTPDISIKTASTATELRAVAKLRAEAYYADDHSRFAHSFKKQFAAQEVESLRQRTTPASSSGRAQLCECLVSGQQSVLRHVSSQVH
eukprot:GHUV01051456.1.p1 GENE.GHUV01051456.1~~GHUV01051456.1.p1  ORF type:complete len:237 (+),score=48.58 GHUV01051456.1:625-1335(+)